MKTLCTALCALLLLPLTAAAQEEAPPARPAKASLAVMPFTFSNEVVERDSVGYKLVVKQFKTSALTNKFITALVKTRKFDVVERKRVDDLLNEMQLTESGLTDLARAVKAGEMIGADYFLMGEISVFTITTQWKAIPFTKKWQRIITAKIIVDMRIVDTRTSKIVAADKGEATWEQKTMYPNQFETKEVPPEMVDTLQRTLCDDLTIKTIDGVYPIKIIGVAGGTISLNRGEGGGLLVGQVLDVFSPGEELVDPDTGESLGFEEVKIGRLRVSEILARFSKAQLVDGSPQKGAICRKADDAGILEPAPKRAKPPGWK